MPCVLISFRLRAVPTLFSAHLTQFGKFFGRQSPIIVFVHTRKAFGHSGAGGSLHFVKPELAILIRVDALKHFGRFARGMTAHFFQLLIGQFRLRQKPVFIIIGFGEPQFATIG